MVEKTNKENKEKINKEKTKKESKEKINKESKRYTNKNYQKRKRNKRRKKRNNKKIIIISFLFIIILITIITYFVINDMNEKKIIKERELLTNEIISHYNKYVIIENESKIYELKNDQYIESGKIGKSQELTLKDIEITYKDEYLEITSLDKQYYINYKDVKKIEQLTEINETKNRYKKYIVFNKNIITKDTTNFYDEYDNLVYSFNRSFELPIIINKENIFGVEYNKQLLYIKNEDVKEIIDSNNTNEENTKGISVLNYHFFNDSNDPSDSCNQIICLSTNNLKKHLDYIKQNNIFTPTMKELEMYIDGYIKLPKSVVLTIDDGWRAKIGSDVISEYKLNATIFLMSKYYDPRNYQNDYIEVHSHGYDIHEGGVCPGGQGGAIKCLEKNKLLEDLNASRDKLNNTTYFCYPFYEYNDYSIQVLKEAGFTMAFGGHGEGGNYQVKPGINKFKLPRYVIYSYTNEKNIANYIK